MSFEEFNNIEASKDQPFFLTKNLSQSSNLINNFTFIRLFKFKKFLDDNEKLESPSIDMKLFNSPKPIKYKIILIPSSGSSLSIKIEFSPDKSISSSNCFVTIQLSVHSKAREMFTSTYEDTYSLSNPFFIKQDYIVYDKQMLELKMINPLIIRVRVYLSNTSKPYDNSLGLINEGNTCYMNSIIQNLANIPSIYNRILEIPSKEDDKLFSFQNLLYHLKLKSSKNALGVRFSDYIQNVSFLGNFYFKSQNDVQEVFSYVFEYLSTKEKEYCDAPVLSKLFEGIIQSDIKCEKKAYSSSMKEPFSFLSLNINNCFTLSDCIEKYLQVETLAGDNCLELDKQKYEAIKTISFKLLPKVLLIQLKRFSVNNKLSQKVTYPNELDLGAYFNGNSSYLLYSVIVHEGSLNTGHYFVFIRQFKEDKWLKFNDNKVTYANKKEVFDDNYGGWTDWIEVSNDGEIFSFSKDIDRTAYILTYIEKSYITEAFCDVSHSQGFVKRLYHLPNQKSICDYFYLPYHKEDNQKTIEDIPISLIEEEDINSKPKGHLTSVYIDVFDYEMRKTNRRADIDTSKPVYSLDLINITVSISQNPAKCRLAKFNAFNMFICFVNDSQEDLKPLLVKGVSETSLKLFIFESIEKQSTVFIIQRYSFHKPHKGVEINHILTNEDYFVKCFYHRHVDNLFQVVSTENEIENAKTFEEVKLKPYQYTLHASNEGQIVRLVLKKMD